MSNELTDRRIKVFATCPESTLARPGAYLQLIVDVARWSERAGCEGILVYTSNYSVDPWLVSQIIIAHTERLHPLVAVEPVYMHPYSAAKMVASLALLYGRRLYLNMVAGGFRNDLAALKDTTPHDERYARLAEYTTIIMELLKSPTPVTFDGHYYGITNLRMIPQLPAALLPGLFVSGSSAAGLAAARQLGATAVQYPRPVGEYEADPPPQTESMGIRIGIIARERADEAWTVARSRFPEDRRGQIAHRFAMSVSDSEWHQQLSRLGQGSGDDENPYWMVPFENYKEFCPYLVGSYDRVAEEVARYIKLGYLTFILAVVVSPDDMRHIGIVFDRAAQRAGAERRVATDALAADWRGLEEPGGAPSPAGPRAAVLPPPPGGS